MKHVSFSYVCIFQDSYRASREPSQACTAEFLNFGPVDILHRIILSFWGQLVHCGMFGDIPGFYLEGASTNVSPVVSTKISPHCPLSPGGKNQPWMRIAVLLFHTII